ncbi:MAG: hypothetical protein ABF719_09625 [Acetobacter sp.]|uniref:hypothetical protein n=1 Tax=Acetobacter sp. TaxID=440 RepID=UPI0039E98E06
MIVQETGENVTGIESDGGCDVEEFDHVDPALAGFVFRDDRNYLSISSFDAIITTANKCDGWFFFSSRSILAARSRNFGGKRLDLLLMTISCLTGLSVSIKPRAV